MIGAVSFRSKAISNHISLLTLFCTALFLSGHLLTFRGQLWRETLRRLSSFCGPITASGAAANAPLSQALTPLMGPFVSFDSQASQSLCLTANFASRVPQSLLLFVTAAIKALTITFYSFTLSSCLLRFIYSHLPQCYSCGLLRFHFARWLEQNVISLSLSRYLLAVWT